MATIINADTSNGLKLTSDTSGEIKLQSAGADIATVSSTGLAMASGKTLTGDAVSSGKILQVLQATKTDTFSTNSTTFVDITDMAVTITPSSTSSKILVFNQLQAGTTGHGTIKTVRTVGGTTSDILVGDADGNRSRGNSKIYISTWNPTTCVAQLLDSPNTTSAVTYKVQCAVPHSASYYIYVNRAVSSSGASDFAYDVRSSSTITVMEVGA
jgi:hypothetical protein